MGPDWWEFMSLVLKVVRFISLGLLEDPRMEDTFLELTLIGCQLKLDRNKISKRKGLQ